MKILDFFDINSATKFGVFVTEKYGVEVYEFVKSRIHANDISGIWGYLLEFFDSVGMIITIHSHSKESTFGWLVSTVNGNWFKHQLIGDIQHMDFCKTRREAQQDAFKKAFEIYEQKGFSGN